MGRWIHDFRFGLSDLKRDRSKKNKNNTKPLSCEFEITARAVGVINHKLFTESKRKRDRERERAFVQKS